YSTSMCPVAFAMCLAWLLAPRGTADPLSQLNAIARKYQEIDSYESSVTARRPLGGGVFGQLHLEFACASARMTPKNLPIPCFRKSFECILALLIKKVNRLKQIADSPGPDL